MGEKPHKRLEVWKKAIELTVLIYKITDSFPELERFGLISQMRRAVISIASNIAEGAARQTKKEFAQFLHNAQGSLSELDTQNIIAKRLGYLSEDVFKKVEIELDSEDRMLTGLIKSLRRNIKE
jgi:four helix bundle protein